MGNVIKRESTDTLREVREFVLNEWNFPAAVATELPPAPETVAEAVAPPVEPDWEELLRQERETGRRQGHEAGLQEGAARARRELTSALAGIAAAVEELGKARQDMLRENEEALVQLALEIARKVIVQESEQSERFVRRVAKSAIDLLADRQQVVIRVHPQDMAVMQSADSGVSAAGSGVEIVADEYIMPGGCIVQSQSSTVDADLRTQLEQIEEALLRKEHGTED